jgi:hypothetical protein
MNSIHGSNLAINGTRETYLLSPLSASLILHEAKINNIIIHNIPNILLYFFPYVISLNVAKAVYISKMEGLYFKVIFYLFKYNYITGSGTPGIPSSCLIFHSYYLTI